MALPLKLRNYYDKVVTPVTGMAGQLTMMGGRHRAGGSQLTGTNVQHMVQAYITMNRFLSRFLEHVSLCSTPSAKYSLDKKCKCSMASGFHLPLRKIF